MRSGSGIRPPKERGQVLKGMKTSIVVFDNFTDIDLWLMWDLLNRVRVDDWRVQIVGEKDGHVSVTGVVTKTHARLEEAASSDAVLIVSGPGTRDRILDDEWLAKLKLDPSRQVIGSICSGSLILAKLGLLDGKTATTYPTSKPVLESLGVEVVEKPFIAHGNIATAGGCLAQQYLIGWVVEKLADKDWSDLIVKAIQPVGEGLFFDDAELLAAMYRLVKVSAAR
jgi:transcriptional regulator GlxA family with amidase domain